MHTRVNGGAVIGLDGAPICVEVDISSGMPKTTIVGLPDAAVDEARERVRSAIRNAGAGFPTKRVTVNLAPAHIRKEGAGYDLPIAVGMLVATGQVCESAVQDTLFLGELALDGELRHVRGVLSVAAAARDASVRRIVVPKVDAEEASLIDGIEVVAVDSLRDWIEIATEERPLTDAIWPKARPVEEDPGSSYDGHDFSDVRGQEHVKRALEVAAAGGHNLLMCGPPGAGKTLLASCLPGILPPLTTQEALEVTKIASVSGMTGGNKLIRERPFRAPHHTISNAGLVGGGQRLRPGEVTMAHRGVLFLDELPEFSVRALETMRQPLEDRHITISRAHGSVTYPADICLIAAMNPLPLRQLRLGPALHLHRWRRVPLPAEDLGTRAGPHRPVRRCASGRRAEADGVANSGCAAERGAVVRGPTARRSGSQCPAAAIRRERAERQCDAVGPGGQQALLQHAG